MYCSLSLALKEGEWGVKLSLKRGFVSILLLRCWPVKRVRDLYSIFLRTSPFPDPLVEAVFKSKKDLYCIFSITSPYPRDTTVFSFHALENALEAKKTLNVVIAGASLYEPRVLGSNCFSVSGFFSFILIGPFNNNTFKISKNLMKYVSIKGYKYKLSLLVFSLRTELLRG